VQTTFLKHVLTAKHGHKILVIQNEFGAEIGIEQATIMNSNGQSSQEWLELPNGCICCTVKDSFVATIEELVRKKRNFDFVFVETDGLADPGPVASVFWLDDALESSLCLDGIIAIVDAKHILRQLDELKPQGVINEAQRQIAFADRIIINKIDLVTQSELQAVEARIRQINSVAAICFSQKSAVNLEKVLQLGAYELSAALTLEMNEAHVCHDGNSSDCKHPHMHHQHDDSIHSITLQTEVPMDLREFQAWLGSWLWKENSCATEVFRVKGIVAIRGAAEKYMLQAVHALFDLQPSQLCWTANESPYTKVVFIGRQLEPLRESFASLFASHKR